MLLMLAAAAAMPNGDFTCAIDEVAAISVDHGKSTASMIEGLPADSLKFRMSIIGNTVTLDWPNSPIQASGKQPMLQTGPNAAAVLFVSPGPCLFTEGSCANMFNFAQQPDKSLWLLVTPTALTYDREHDVRFPFLVSMEGHCVAQGMPK